MLSAGSMSTHFSQEAFRDGYGYLYRDEDEDVVALYRSIFTNNGENLYFRVSFLDVMCMYIHIYIYCYHFVFTRLLNCHPG